MYRSAPSPTRLAISARTNTGLKRKGNLDAFLVTDFETCIARDPTEGGGLVTGPAGLGLAVFTGHLLDWSRSPEQAAASASLGFKIAAVAANAVLEALSGAPPPRGDGAAPRLVEILHIASASVRRAAGDPRFVDTASSVTLAVVQNDRVEIVQAGETRAYLFRGGRLFELTKGERPDAPPGYRPQPFPPSRPLGVPTPSNPAVFSTDLRPGDALLLCSRGLPAVLDNASIVAALHRNTEPDGACKALVDAAVRARGEHNVTVLLATPVAAPQGGMPGR